MQVENLGMRVSEYIPEGLLLPFSYHLYLPNGNELVLTIRTLFCKVLQRQLKFSLPISPINQTPPGGLELPAFSPGRSRALSPPRALPAASPCPPALPIGLGWDYHAGRPGRGTGFKMTRLRFPHS